MNMIAPLMAAKDYPALVRVYEQLELQHSIEPTMIDMSQIYAPYLALYIVLNDLNSARFLRKRMNAACLDIAEVNAVWNVCTALWEQRYPDFYTATEAYPWSGDVEILMRDIRASVRKRLVQLLATSYESIAVEDAMWYFGLPEEELIPALAAEGWVCDPMTKILTRQKKPESPSRTPSTLAHVSHLVDVVMELEKF